MSDYGISGRYEAIANKLGHSDPAAWAKDSIRAGRFPNFKPDSRTKVQLAREARAHLARERGINDGTILVLTKLCNTCGSGRYPHVCW